MKQISKSLSITFCILALSACSNPQPGPDKTVAGAVLGAGWGAGSGAIIGNQVDHSGEGIAIGAGFGAVGGAMSGYAYDDTENSQIELEKQLASLKIQNLANRRQMERLQANYDTAADSPIAGGVFQVFFDDDATNLRPGSISNLEVIADSLKASPNAYTINVIGHADDAGTPEYNQRLSEARSRSVSAYLGARGISMDQIVVKSFGSTRPIASNATPVGRQLNRRVDVYVARR